MYTFNYVSGGRDLVRVPSVVVTSVGPPVVIADPAFGPPDSATAAAGPSALDPAAVSPDSVSRHFERLPGTADEAAAIKDIVPDASIYTGATATETLMKAMSVPRILHVATHGFFLADQDVSAAAAERRGSDAAVGAGIRFGQHAAIGAG